MYGEIKGSYRTGLYPFQNARGVVDGKARHTGIVQLGVVCRIKGSRFGLQDGPLVVCHIGTALYRFQLQSGRQEVFVRGSKFGSTGGIPPTGMMDLQGGVFVFVPCGLQQLHQFLGPTGKIGRGIVPGPCDAVPQKSRAGGQTQQQYRNGISTTGWKGRRG
eukprot:scaffold14956_cov164-Amphora_coffeaeformis.AAC.1